MNRAEMIKRQLNKAGKTVYFKDKNWLSAPFCACLSPLWRKKTANFEPKYTELGLSFREYFLYTGPYDHKVTALSDEAMVISGEDKFEIKCSDAVIFNNEIIYYTAILKKLKGDDGLEN